jgi:hypothetical protein
MTSVGCSIGCAASRLNNLQPYVSCFNSGLEEAVFRHSVNDFRLELPTNFSAFPEARNDLERQLEHEIAMTKSLARKCHERTGDAISYMGGEDHDLRRSDTTEMGLL